MRVILSEKPQAVVARNAAPRGAMPPKEDGAGRSRAVGLR